MDLQKFAKGESNLIKYSKLDIGDGNPKNLIRWFKEEGINFQVKSGYGYNRVHATGEVQHIGSMDELESAIVNNITKMIKNGHDLSKVNTYKINVNGYDLFYRAIKTGDGVIRVPTYFTR
ncbi:hypothetical protein [Clostridium sporogenes]|nr:hypothetical protein [Clostridium sporogenes]AUM95039.1 hypothetical protein RSJ11_07735 [Clostridium sporogenes]AVQ52478.1 hypothetical protein C7M59_06275 [Clostridium botulinum]